jgi:citrate lyase subunit beta/citryl-CoA lyase
MSEPQAPGAARSLLYVPGTRPDRFGKAMASGADAIILDLEDAVAPADNDAARENVAAWLRARATRGDEADGAGHVEVWVRVNGGALLAADAREVLDAGARNISLPKASLDALARFDAIAGEAAVVVSALIETAEGVLDARAIAADARVERLQIGEADLGAELNVEPGDDAFAPMRAQVVLASAAAGIEPPVGPVSTDFTELDAYRASTRALKAAGFGGRAAIHPAQVAIVNEVFTPTEEELARARRVVQLVDDARGGVTLDDDGRMLDEAFVRAARRTLARARKPRR